MAAVTFDTLAYVKRLEAAGVEPKIAEAEAQALAEALKGIIGELATRADIQELRHEMKEMESRIILRLGALIVAGVTVLAVLMRIL